MRLRATHRLHAGDGDRPPDALAISDEGRRFFVPGWLPCGECGPCRRGWVAGCPRGQALGQDAAIETSDRFVAPLDEPPGVAAIEDRRAACAGAVAEMQELSARAGLGTGDLAVWIGSDARCALGARLSAARGCTTFVLQPGASPGPGITGLDAAAGAESWRQALATAASTAPGGFQERRLFVSRAEPALVSAALSLIQPGATLAFVDGRGAATLEPGQLLSCRVVVGAGRGYHPDLVPEALAALRAQPGLVDDLIAEGAPRADRLTLVSAQP